MARIILFGGSFDPIHHGHLIIARAAMQQCRAAGVLFVLARVSPHKLRRPLTSATHRTKMLALAIRHEPGFAVSTMELQRTGPSYTWDTIQRLRQSRPEDNFILLLGADQLPALGRWHCAHQLLATVDLAVACRDGDAPNTPRPPGLTAAIWRKVLAARIPTPRIDISATDIRRRRSRGLSIRYLVPDPVLRYILQYSLYAS